MSENHFPKKNCVRTPMMLTDCGWPATQRNGEKHHFSKIIFPTTVVYSSFCLISSSGNNKRVIVYLAYLRVSHDSQNLARQYAAVKEWCPDILEEDIFKDKESGDNFNRTGLIGLINKVKEYRRHGIEVMVYVHEVARLGRDYKETKRLLEDFENWGVSVYCPEFKKFYDMMPDEFAQSIMGQFLVSMQKDMLIMFAQQELENIRKRREEGYALYTKKCEEQGIKRGRPSKTEKINKDLFMVYYNHYLEGVISAEDVMRVMQISKSKFYRLIKEWNLTCKKSN